MSTYHAGVVYTMSTYDVKLADCSKLSVNGVKGVSPLFVIIIKFSKMSFLLTICFVCLKE